MHDYLVTLPNKIKRGFLMKKFIKRTAVIILTVSMLFTNTFFAYGNVAEVQEVPQYIPLRLAFEGAGAEVRWSEGQIFASMVDGNKWVFTPGAAEVLINSDETPLAFPVIMADGRAMISFNDVAFLFGDAGEYTQTVMTAVTTALQVMEISAIPGMTIAIVDAETGFTWTQGLGYADSVNNVFVDEHTLFQIGSTSKPFTAVAVMQLVEAGIIDLDEPIVTYIPEFSMFPSPIFGGNSDNITVRMLLNNTSGILGDWLYAFYYTGHEHYQGVMNGLLDWLATREMSFEEGTRFDYANNNWTLLGILVAKMTGHSNYFEGFDQYTTENIFEPLGMERSTFVLPQDLNNVAMPYIVSGEQDIMTVVGPLSAGSMFSSAHDMARFMHTILGDGTLDNRHLLSQDTIAYMLQKQTNNVEMEPPFLGYGLGFIHMAGSDGFKSVGHGGGTIHYFTEMIFDLDSSLGVFVSANSTTGATSVSSVASAILQSAIIEKGGEVHLTPSLINHDVVPITLSSSEVETLARFEGIYSFGAFGIMDLKLIDDTLTAAASGMIIELIPMSDGTFESMLGRFSFESVDDSINATLIVMGIMGVQGTKINIEEHLATEDFAQWVGVYNFVPKVANEVIQITPITIFINDMGIPMMSMQSAMGVQEVMLTLVDDMWFLQNLPVRFSLDEDGVANIDLVGGRFVR